VTRTPVRTLPVAPHGFALACPVCEVSAGPYPTWGEARLLGDRHDQVHHRGRPTTEVSDLGLCESCRRAPAVASWTRPDAGAPFAMCASCHPDQPHGSGARTARGSGRA
jgi:hypothetical protein